MTDSLDQVLTENQKLYQKVQELTAENKVMREVLEKIVTDNKAFKFSTDNMLHIIESYKLEAARALAKVKR